MEILKNNTNLNFVINTEQNFRTDLGWSENFVEFEKEVLEDIINPAKNYETVRYIHRPYDRVINTGLTINQSDIWFNFYFISGSTYMQDYRSTNVNITLRENELMLRQSTESFFRLEFYKTPTVISNTGTTLTCEPPTRQNRRFVSSKNLSLPLGEKFLYTSTTSSFYIHIPVFTGSNYRNKENMYLFWFDDESNLEDINLSGTITLDQYTFNNTGLTIQTILFKNEINEITQVNIPIGTTSLIGWTGQTFNINNVNVTYDKRSDGSPVYHGMNTFFMAAKFFNGKDGSILDFTNSGFTSSYVITEEKDMYYQVDFDHYERTYQIYKYSGVTGDTSPIRVGTDNTTSNSINFYEKGGGTVLVATPTPTPTSTSTSSSTNTPTPTPTSTPTPTATNTSITRYTYTRFNVLDDCTGWNPVPVWSYNNYTDGYYTIDETLYELRSQTYTTYTNEITSATPSSCTVAPGQTVISGFVSLDNEFEITACSGGGYGEVSITVVGTTICDATSIVGLSSLLYGNIFQDMDNNEVFYVSDGISNKEFTRDGFGVTATPTGVGCTNCI